MGRAASLEARNEGNKWTTVVQFSLPLGMMQRATEFREGEAHCDRGHQAQWVRLPGFRS